MYVWRARARERESLSKVLLKIQPSHIYYQGIHVVIVTRFRLLRICLSFFTFHSTWQVIPAFWMCDTKWSGNGARTENGMQRYEYAADVAAKANVFQFKVCIWCGAQKKTTRHTEIFFIRIVFRIKLFGKLPFKKRNFVHTHTYSLHATLNSEIVEMNRSHMRVHQNRSSHVNWSHGLELVAKFQFKHPLIHTWGIHMKCVRAMHFRMWMCIRAFIASVKLAEYSWSYKTSFFFFGII